MRFPAFNDFLKDDDCLKPVVNRVYYRLLDELDFTTPREIKASGLALAMGLDEDAVGQALTTLLGKGFVREHGRRSVRQPRSLTLVWNRFTDLSA